MTIPAPGEALTLTSGTADPATADPVLAGDLSLDDMRLLVVLSEELHFGRAASRLHLSQPGLSYRVQRLEAALGYEVVTRNRREVRLSPAGDVVVRGARRLLDEARRLVDEGARVARGEAGTIRLGFVGSSLYGLIPQVVREVRRRHPDLVLLLEEQKTAAQTLALRRGLLDIGVLHLPLTADATAAGLVSAVATTSRVGLALPADHRLAGSGHLDLADVADEPFVLFPRHVEPATHDSYVDACVRSGFSPRVTHEAVGLQTILELVAAGMGVAFVADSVARVLRHAGVVFAPLRGLAPVLVTGPAWREPAEAPAVAVVRDTILDVARTRPDQEVPVP